MKTKISELSLTKGMDIATSRPKQAGKILARSLAEECHFFTPQLAIGFATCLLRALNQGKTEVSEEIIERVEKWPIRRAAFLAAKNPDRGMQILAAIVFKHLINEQRLSKNGVIEFVTELADSFLHAFPTAPSSKP